MDEKSYLKKLHDLWKKNWPKNAPNKPHYPKGEKPICEYLTEWARENPDKKAIRFYGYDISYKELDLASNRFANLLINLGIKPGEGVALFMPSCPQFNIAYFGIMKCGAIHVPVSPLSKEMELKHQLGDSKPKVVFCFDALLPVLEPVCQNLGIEHIIATSYSELKQDCSTIQLPDFFKIPKVDLKDGIIDFFPALNEVSDAPPDHTPALDDVAALNYTGGTTGLPKGCVHTHRNLIYTAAAFMLIVFGHTENKASDKIMMTYLPQFWIAGETTGLLFPVFHGATVVMLARWDTVAFMEAVDHYKVNQCIMLVDSIDDVLNHPKLSDYDLHSMELTPCISFIKKLNKDYRNKWEKVTGSTMFETTYGMTETHSCDTFTKGFQDDDFDLSVSPAFVGIPVPGTEIKICDFITGELKPFEEEGEIVVRTPTLLKGYWNMPDSNAELFFNGWFRTGDLGTITKDGFLRYLGRRKEMLKVNGMSVFPTEIEAMLGQNPAIAACGVVGRPDDQKGQVPVAFITLKKGFEETEESLAKWCKNAMAIFKVPEIHIVSQLPMTGTGKVIKNELEKMIC
ncbi:AMP-binding protein [Desulforhopalus singaporensis]|uniref:Fatty-acyl-CoA synthase n=1 Tax=Desulforhopalus singaporensis TaxID=91360 RepID=A0A1H0V0Y1_9BACT|nr:AMP-binding protein [Desulforhopalus singaporensis]SDP72003.1 fatty-acyl-CoA synthase [Desulforhopalus singaporensis]